MAQFEILHGPNENRLVDALRHRRHSQQVYFQVRSEDSPRSFRFFVYIDGLEYETVFEDIWRIIAQPVKGADKLIGIYCTGNRKGTLANDGGDDLSIATLGFDHDIEQRLYRAGVRTLTDLLGKSEIAVCRLLLDDSLGFGMSNELVEQAIERFERLRARMDVFGHGFAGRWHNAYELSSEF